MRLRIRIRSLQGRLTALVLAVMTLLWLGAVAVTWFDARRELDELLDSHLAQAAALLVAQQARETDEEAFADAPNLSRYSTHVAFQVWNGNMLLLHSANAPHVPMSQGGQGFETRSIDGEAWRVFAAHGGEQDLQVYVGERIAVRYDILSTVSGNLLAPLALALPLLVLGVWWAVRSGMSQLRQLGSQLAARTPQSLAPVGISNPPSEITPLIDALNHLFGRISSLLESERRFTADAAHELRTPIAAIRIQAQVAQAAADAKERLPALQATIAGCDRANHLVDQMLQLARLESPVALPGRVDLPAVAQRILADLAPAALAKDQDLELRADSPLVVSGDEALVGVLVRNLVDNAIRYGGKGTPIGVSILAGPAPELVVEDGGPGMGQADRDRLGERFFRVLGSDEAGSGLGWSIVRRIALVLGLQVEVRESQRLGGLAVHVRFPL